MMGAILKIILILRMMVDFFLIFVMFKFIKQVEVFKQFQKNYSTLDIFEEIIKVLGKKISAQEKLEEINKLFIKNFDVNYSTIVYYTGKEHVVKSSNVEENYYPIFENLAEEPIFKHNLSQNIPKYVTSATGAALKYPGASERGIRSVMILPLYLNGQYAGYWLLEDLRLDAFDRIEKVQLSILKNNLILILENFNQQTLIEKMAITDRLTGLYNRYYLYSKGLNLVNLYPVSTVVMFDIDFFKKINDTYGHDVGDKILVSVVEVTNKHLSEDDIFVRYGGEEFIILFPGKSLSSCRSKIEQIRELISRTTFYAANNQSIHVTVSYGMSIFEKDRGNFDDSIKNADIALYKAKQSGRNRVEVVV